MRYYTLFRLIRNISQEDQGTATELRRLSSEQLQELDIELWRLEHAKGGEEVED